MRALLTGAIGAEVARRLSAGGARLVLSGRRESALAGLARELDDATPIPADLSQRGEAERLAHSALGALGEIDALVNNAGASIQGLTWVVGDGEAGRDVMETNVWSPLALAAAIAPGMVERGRGASVNVGSMARVAPFPRSLRRLARGARDRDGGHADGARTARRRVVEVALGPVDTPASRENRILAGAERWLDARPGLGTAAAAAAAAATARHDRPELAGAADASRRRVSITCVIEH